MHLYCFAASELTQSLDTSNKMQDVEEYDYGEGEEEDEEDEEEDEFEDAGAILDDSDEEYKADDYDGDDNYNEELDDEDEDLEITTRKTTKPAKQSKVKKSLSKGLKHTGCE